MSQLRSLVTGLLILAFSVPLFAQQPRVDALGDPLPQGAIARLGTHRLSPPGWRPHLALTPDGKLLATSDAPELQFWDPDTGKLVRSWSEGERGAGALAISPNGQWLASGDIDQPLRLRDAHSGKLKWTLDHKGGSCAFSSDNQMLLCGRVDGRLSVYDLASGKIKRTLDSPLATYQVAFSPDGRYFTAWGAHRFGQATTAVVVWETATGEQVCLIEPAATAQVQGVVFLPDQRHLLVSSVNLAIYEIATGKRVRVLQTPGIGRLATDRLSKRMIAGNGEIWDLEKLQVLRRLSGMGAEAAVTMSADGTRAASTPPLRVWDVVTGKATFIPPGHGYPVHQCVFSPDDQQIATLSDVEGIIRLWNAKTGRPLATLEPKPASLYHYRCGSLRFFGDPAQLVIGSERWDLRTRKRLKPLGEVLPPGAEELAFGSLLSPDTTMVVDWSGQTGLRFWDVQSRRVLRRVKLPYQQPSSSVDYVFSPCGKTLAVTHHDSVWSPTRPFPSPTLFFMEVATGKLLHQLRPAPDRAYVADFSQDGQWLVLSTHREKYALEIWHVPSGQLHRTITEPAVLSWYPRCNVAPHGQLLASCDPGHAVVLFEVATGQYVAKLPGHRAEIQTLAFSNDARYLVSSSRDRTSLVWSLESLASAQIEKDEDRLWHALTAEAAQAYPILWALVESPKAALALAQKRLQPDPIVERKELDRLIADLSSVVFYRRNSAMQRLRQLGMIALPALQAAREQNRDAEARRRIADLLQTIPTQPPSPDLLRDLRVMQMLEMIGTPEARQMLERSAQSPSPGPRATAARSALARLQKRPS